MIKGKTCLAFILPALLAAPAACGAQEDLQKVYSDAAAQWRDGRPEDAEGALKYVAYRSSDQALNSAALRDLTALLAEAGKNREALAYLLKAEILAPEDFYIQYEKGWNLLGLEKHQDARAAFEKAITLTADQDLANQARFALAMAETELAGPTEAIDQLRAVYSRYPYLLSPCAQLMSADLELLKKRPHAINFIKEALNYDPRNIQAEIDLARLYDQSDFYVPAWQTYYTLSDLDPEEPFFSEKERKLRKYVKGKVDNLLYWSRMAWPAHKEPLPQDRSAKVRIGLYSDSAGVPSLIRSFSFIASTDFDLIDTRLGRITTGKSGMQWTVFYDEKNRVYQVSDSMGSAAHTTSNSLRIVPRTGGVVLIKNPELPGVHGVNRSDKEAAGELTVLLREKGFWLINETPLETIVSPITAGLAGGSKLLEHLKAVAVTVRTRLRRLAFLAGHESREYQLCDSPHCVPFAGMQSESSVSAAAALATAGETLMLGETLADADFHRACGGFTETGVSDLGRPIPLVSPFNLYARMLKGPPDALLCLPEDKTTSSDVYWTLLLKPEWIESRVNRTHKIGYIRAIIPLTRDASGRVRTVRVEGTAGSAVITGGEAVTELLGAGALRSTLFTIRPLFKGKSPEFFVVRGIGTGEGKGLCLLGARGMAKTRGAGYRDILSHYFPLYKVRRK